MRSIMGYITLAGMVAITVPAVASAQDSTAVDRKAAAMVLDHTFNAPVGEPIRVFLAKGTVYRAEIEGTGIQLQLRPLMSSVQVPLIQPVLAGSSSSGSSLYSITPRADAEYEFKTIAGDAGRSVNLHVWALPPKEHNKP